jgi:hypothetical protein
VKTLEHSPFSPDLLPPDFLRFPQIKPKLKEQRFCVATNIIKNATEEPKRLSQNGFQEFLPHLYIR